MARHAAAGCLGTVLALVLAAWLAPALTPVGDAGVRAVRGAALLAVWAAPLALGLALVEGQFPRAARPWLRTAGVAALLGAALGGVLGAATSAWPATFVWHVPGLLLPPVPAGAALGVAASLAVALAFRRERHLWQMLAGGLVLGAGLGTAWHFYLGALPGLPGALGHVAVQAAALLPAGLLLGLGHGVVREWCKRAWLLVIFGDQPGRLYPLYGAPFTVGTAEDNRLVVDATGGVLAHHLVIRRQRDCGAVEALSPDALVFLHDSRIDVGEVYDGDELQIGETVLRYGVIS